MTSLDLKAKFGEIGLCDCSTGLYSQPNLPWLQNEYNAYYKEMLAYLATEEWRTAWECFNFTNLYVAILQGIYSRGDPQSNTPAIGRWDFKPDASRALGSTTLHSIVAGVDDKGDRFFLDPQNNTLWQPSSNELYSTRRLLF